MQELAAAAIEPPSGTDEEALSNELQRRALELIRAYFSHTTWQAFWRYAVQKDNPADIAQDLGISVWSVYAAKSRILRRLREEFSELID
jgi:RNA polymerase sigma-70 factor (ECF subfamily)